MWFNRFNINDVRFKSDNIVQLLNIVCSSYCVIIKTLEKKLKWSHIFDYSRE